MHGWWIIQLGLVVWFCRSGVISAQPTATVDKTTHLKNETDVQTSSQPKSLTFTASTDQRFFFFKDSRTEDGNRKPVSIYGLRAGFLFPPKQNRPALQGGRPASFKAGVGFYFVNQTLNVPGLLPESYESITRHLRIGTVFYERYLYRRKAFDVSLPIEFGYGHSRYIRNDEQAGKYEIARGVFLPLGVGVSAAYQFPTVRWLRPLHWFGLNFLTGYRFILKRDIPESQINYSGLYFSVGPSFFLENLTNDIKYWRKKKE